MASPLIGMAILACALTSIAVHGAPVHSLSNSADGSLRNGIDMIEAVEKRYEKVQNDASQLQSDLQAAVKAGKLTYADINSVNTDLVNDVTKAITINAKLYAAVSNCVNVPYFLMDSCYQSAALSVMVDVINLETAFQIHSVAAQRLLDQ